MPHFSKGGGSEVCVLGFGKVIFVLHLVPVSLGKLCWFNGLVVDKFSKGCAWGAA